MVVDPRPRLTRLLSKPELRKGKPNRRDFREQPRLPIRVVLDGITHGYNLGAILRLCDAFNCEELVICGFDSGGGRRRLQQAARGTEKWVKWRREKDAIEPISNARLNGYKIVALEQTTTSIRVAEFQPTFPLCLVLGSEANGVSAKALGLIDVSIDIPMTGMANSLNVATAAAIALYHCARGFGNGSSALTAD